MKIFPKTKKKTNKYIPIAKNISPSSGQELILCLKDHIKTVKDFMGRKNGSRGIGK